MTVLDATLDLRAVAAAIGSHYDTVRQGWRAWATPGNPEFRAFPLPFKHPPAGKKGRLAWRAGAIAEWMLARERALGAGRGAPHARPQGRPQNPAGAPTRDRQLIRQRAELAQLMERT